MMEPTGYTEGWPTPGIDPTHALCVLEPGAPHWQWLECRRTGIGGSDVSGILGLNSWDSPLHVWVDKVDPQPDQDEEAMFWGRMHEPTVRAVFAERMGLEVTVPGTLRSRHTPWMICNLDGLCSDGLPLEIKTLAHDWAGDWDDGQVADHAELQVAHGMYVTGAPAAWVACLIGGSRLVIRRVERDDKLIDDLVKVETEFWHDYVLTGEMPPPEPSDAYQDALEERFRLAREGTRDIDRDTRSRLKAMLDQADAAATYAEVGDLARNTIRQLLGDKTELCCDRDSLATWKPNGTFAKKRFRQENPEVWDEFQVKEDVFDLDRLKTERPELYEQYRARVLRLAKDK